METETMNVPIVSRKHTRDSMLKTKSFYRVSKKGKISKIVREHYLRADIPCSSQLCTPCSYISAKDYSGATVPFVLSKTPETFRESSRGHYLIPDTNIFYLCMDIVEHRSAFHDVIVLQTVMDELRHRSLPLYNRLRQLTRSSDKRFYVFHNEFNANTFIEQKLDESANDFNDRAIRIAVRWYTLHLQDSLRGEKDSIPDCILISNDRDNLQRAQKEGCSTLCMEDYLAKLDKSDELLDMLSAVLVEASESKPAETMYAEYLNMTQIQKGIQSGALHQGSLNVSPYNYLEGSVSVPGFDRSVLILGRENINRAVAGDIVVLDILPKSEWRLPSSVIVEDESISKNENPEEDSASKPVVSVDELASSKGRQRTKSGKGTSELLPQPTAKVVGIVKRNWRFYVGHIDGKSVTEASGRMQQSVFLVPMDKRIPRIRFRTRQANSLSGQRIVVSIDKWDYTSRFPEGHFVRALGKLETQGAETEAILMEYDVQYRPFPQSVLDCLPTIGHDWKVPQDKLDPGWKGREDFRELLVCSIDPPGCQDIDDALHARKLPNGNIEAGVHIADVSNFVKPDTAMDDEAAARGTTVYLVDKRIDMLPMLLGTDLCSLRPYVERFAFSVIWELTPDAEIVNVRFTKSVISSKESFSYEQAQLRIDDKSHTDSLTASMRLLLNLSKKLRQKRMDAGALNLASPEVKVHMESEMSDPSEVEVKEMRDTNYLVEEFMLLANISVAKKIYDTFPQFAMLRRHGTPPASNFEALQDMLRVRKGLSLNFESSKALATSLDSCVDSNEPYFNTLVRIMATRCMLSAEYFCSGTLGFSEFRHYGLASDIYTHFTSPIRRYADIVVHRQLAASIELETLHSQLRDKERLVHVCDNINKRHRNGQFAGRASIEYYVGQALKEKTTEQEGFVIKIFSNGLVVAVPKFGIEGLIRTRDMKTPEPSTTYDEDNYVLTISTKSKATQIALFDKVRVEVSVVKDAQNNRKVQLRLCDI